MQYLRYVLLAVAAIGFVASLGYIAISPGGPAAPLPAYATLVANDLRGDPWTFEDVAGDILIVDFWATWCGPCITEIPHYNALHADYKDKGVSLIGLTVDSGTGEEVLEWMASDPDFEMIYPLIMANDALLESFGPVFGFPTTLLVDREGNVIKRWIGATPMKSEQIRELLDELLEYGHVHGEEDQHGH